MVTGLSSLWLSSAGLSGAWLSGANVSLLMAKLQWLPSMVSHVQIRSSQIASAIRPRGFKFKYKSTDSQKLLCQGVARCYLLSLLSGSFTLGLVLISEMIPAPKNTASSDVHLASFSTVSGTALPQLHHAALDPEKHLETQRIRFSNIYLATKAGKKRLCRCSELILSH